MEVGGRWSLTTVGVSVLVLAILALGLVESESPGRSCSLSNSV